MGNKLEAFTRNKLNVYSPEELNDASIVSISFFSRQQILPVCESCLVHSFNLFALKKNNKLFHPCNLFLRKKLIIF